MSASTLQRRYTEAEIEAMATADLLALYKQTGDEELKWPLVLRYEGLIKSAALQIRGVYSSFAQVDDIVSEGILTLLSSIDKFDPEKGIKFETYVAKRIRGMVIDLARKQDWLPRNIRQRAKEIDSAVSLPTRRWRAIWASPPTSTRRRPPGWRCPTPCRWTR